MKNLVIKIEANFNSTLGGDDAFVCSLERKQDS